jgi:hypothetical protein
VHQLEEMFLAYAMGLIKRDPARSRPGEAPMTTTTSATTTSSPAERLRALAGEQLTRDGWSDDRLLDHQTVVPRIDRDPGHGPSSSSSRALCRASEPPQGAP